MYDPYDKYYEFDEISEQDLTGSGQKQESSSGKGKRPQNQKWLPEDIGKKIGALVLSGLILGSSAGLAFNGVSALSGQGKNDGQTASATQKVATADNLKTASGSSIAEGTSNKGSMDVAAVTEAVMPSIVSINNISVKEVENYYNMFGFDGGGRGSQTQKVSSSGSGIIIGQNDEELLIVTNNHVIADSSTLTVGFTDGSAYDAAIKGTDADSDLAVIAVPLDKISEDTMKAVKVIQLGDSSKLKVGEQVVAIGNALGYGQSVTTGIVSALNRSIEGGDSQSTGQEKESDSDSGAVTKFIQTDAAINPGNSGGALLNMDGELVGINSSKLASTEVEGMGYAIPVTQANSILKGLMSQETKSKVDEDKKGSLGITGEDVTSDVASSYGLPKGVYVAKVTKGSAADSAGIKTGFVITAINGSTVETISELKNQLAYYEAGKTVEVTLQIPDNGEYKEKKMKVTLDEPLAASDTEGDQDEEKNSDSKQDAGDENAQGQSGYAYGQEGGRGSLGDMIGDIFGSSQGW